MDALILFAMMLLDPTINRTEERKDVPQIIVADKKKIVYINIQNVTINAGEQIEVKEDK